MKISSDIELLSPKIVVGKYFFIAAAICYVAYRLKSYFNEGSPEFDRSFDLQTALMMSSMDTRGHWIYFIPRRNG